MAPRVLERSADDFLAALEAGRVPDWKESLVVGPALAILGLAARQRPARVLRLLPRRLEACEGWVRALVSELLVYAWWCCAESEPAAREHLNVLAEPDVDEVSVTFRTFALRGAALARLALLCLGHVSVREVDVRMVHFRGSALPAYLFVDADEFFRQHAPLLIRQAGYGSAEEALIQCVQWKGADADIRNKDLQNARYFCAGNSLEILVSGWTSGVDSLPDLARLPRDWEALRAARLLLEAGRQEPAVIAFAQKACDDSARQHTMQAWHERELCVVQLARLGDTPQAELVSQRESMEHSFFGASGRARGLTALVDEHPDQLLPLLDGAIATQDDIPLLYDWGYECRSWQAVLAAGVYARMFHARPLQTAEAKELIEQMLVALRTLPASPQRLGQEALYATLADWLRGNPQPPPSLHTSTSPIERGHALAAELLANAAQRRPAQENGEWLQTFLGDRRGWWDTTNWQLKEGTLSRGSGLYLIFVFPAVRLALAAVGQRYEMTDPGSTLMEARSNAAEVIHRHHSVLMARVDRPERLERALADLEAHCATMPHDERLWNSRGNLLVRLGRVEDARVSLERSLRLPSCEGDCRAAALYDLACVQARSGSHDACRDALHECRRLRPLDASWLAQDSDLQSVRDAPWFQDLIQHPSAHNP